MGRVAIVGSNHVLERRQKRPGAESEDSAIESSEAEHSEGRQLRPSIESTEEASALDTPRDTP